MGKCTTKNCKVSLNVPLDEALGITPYQSSSEELIRLGCLLSIVMPYELSSWMLHQCTGMTVSASTLWNWVEKYGRKAKSRLDEQLEQYLHGESMPTEPATTAPMETMTAAPAPQAQRVYPPCSATLQDQCMSRGQGVDQKMARKPMRKRTPRR